MHRTQGPLYPTYQQCFVQDAHDALLLVQAVIDKKLKAVERRPQDLERSELIKSGNIFIFDERRGHIQRWTDGISWSPSRILGEFLIYREKKPSSRSSQSSLNRRSITGVQNSGMSPEHIRYGSGSINKRSYPTRPRGSSTSLNYPGPDSMNTSMYSSSLANVMNYPSVPMYHSKSHNSEYNLYGSLTSNEQYKENGLIKKTISVPYKGASFRLISYYFPEDVEKSLLKIPSRDPKFRSMDISPELAETKHMKTNLSFSGFDYYGQYQQHLAVEDDDRKPIIDGHVGGSMGSISTPGNTSLPAAHMLPTGGNQIDPHMSNHLNTMGNGLNPGSDGQQGVGLSHVGTGMGYYSDLNYYSYEDQISQPNHMYVNPRAPYDLYSIAQNQYDRQATSNEYYPQGRPNQEPFPQGKYHPKLVPRRQQSVSDSSNPISPHLMFGEPNRSPAWSSANISSGQVPASASNTSGEQYMETQPKEEIYEGGVESIDRLDTSISQEIDSEQNREPGLDSERSTESTLENPELEQSFGYGGGIPVTVITLGSEEFPQAPYSTTGTGNNSSNLHGGLFEMPRESSQYTIQSMLGPDSRCNQDSSEQSSQQENASSQHQPHPHYLSTERGSFNQY